MRGYRLSPVTLSPDVPVPPVAPRPARRARPRGRLALLAVAALAVVGGCARPTNTVSDYGPRAEANVMEGCLASFDEAQGDLVSVDDKGTTEKDDDEVVIADGAPADQLAYCGCIYEGLVENIPFDTFSDLETQLTDNLDSVEQDGGEAGPDQVPQQLADVYDGCATPQ